MFQNVSLIFTYRDIPYLSKHLKPEIPFKSHLSMDINRSRVAVSKRLKVNQFGSVKRIKTFLVNTDK